jgi:hypothetical protein
MSQTAPAPNPLNSALSGISNMKDDFISNMILGFILFIVILMIVYIIYLTKLSSRECSYMNDMYGTLNGNIRSINANDPDCSGNLNEYYIKTAYNACSGGSYKNDVVNICNLKTALKQGVRGLDFEIYSIDNKAVVATSTADNYYIKETYNSVDFSDVMNTIQNYAFSGSTAPNFTDPILIHLRFMSNNQSMYTNLATLLKSYDSILLGKEYSYETAGHNLGGEPLLNFMNKVILIFDRSNTAFLENKDLMEYVNMTSNSIFMRAYSYYDVKNNPDLDELTEYNKKNMTIVFPDSGSNPPNPNGVLAQDSGCQMIAMRYQVVDNYLLQNTAFFDNCTYAFCLKPQDLRYQPVIIPEATPQDPALSYATRNVTTDFYSFDF